VMLQATAACCTIAAAGCGAVGCRTGGPLTSHKRSSAGYSAGGERAC
jgi:hypothetical protein